MKTKQPELNKITALYERLSRDDEQSGDRIQQIDIYLKYVGKLDVPMPELTPEQIKEERKRRKRAWNRTYWRRRKEREQTEQTAKEKELSEAVG